MLLMSPAVCIMFVIFDMRKASFRQLTLLSGELTMTLRVLYFQPTTKTPRAVAKGEQPGGG